MYVPTRNWKQFTWDKGSRRFTAEASDLVLGPGELRTGLIVEGPQGGRVHMVVVRVDVQEGDLRFWELEPANPADLALTAGATIFND